MYGLNNMNIDLYFQIANVQLTTENFQEITKPYSRVLEMNKPPEG